MVSRGRFGVVVRHCSGKGWNNTVIPILILQEAVESIASEIGVSFSWLELYERFQFLEQHFHAFKLVRHTYDVYWNMQSNTVTILLTEFQSKKNQLTAAYYYPGDIEYPRIAMLFGMEEVKKENNTEVFVISDAKIPISEPRIGP
ncbi:hypothetical protein SASPL_147315 [Salvia splendens]|uniref:Uncharacterized protein n=1 Tax=Salvia splendens TaxID=180675 RepID=A0A8X8WE89_SALSN|nr:hypothetical protein SASPL_147315 [Salvia splendens]